MSKTKKRIVTYLTIIIALLTLISTCVLGNTFARYITSGSATGEVNVAKWDVANSVSGVTSFKTGNMTPKQAAWNYSSYSSYDDGGVRSNTLNIGQLIGLKNSGEVEASVTLTVTSTIGYKNENMAYVKTKDTTFQANTNYYQAQTQTAYEYTRVVGLTSTEYTTNNNNGNYYYTYDSGSGEYSVVDSSTAFISGTTYYTRTSIENITGYTAATVTSENSISGDYYVKADDMVYSHIVLSLYNSSTYDDSTKISLDDNGQATVTLSIPSTNDTWDIYANLVWTSDLSSDCFAETADAEDTWIGENVTTITYMFDWVAVQNTQNPSA